VVDRFSRWPEAFPLPGISAAEVAQKLLSEWIPRYGCPESITSDRGTQFTSAVWKKVTDKLGIKCHFTTAFHPQANGLVERFHRTLKASLRARLSDESWVHEVPWVMLGFRSTARDDADFTPADVVFGAPLRLPADLPSARDDDVASFVRELNKLMSTAAPVPARHNCAKDSKFYVPSELARCSHVWVRTDTVKKPLERPYKGPFAVKERGEKAFVLLYGDRLEKVSIDRLKPVCSDEQVTPAAPPRRGRPRKCRR